jgi:hypothetical protein
MFTIPSNYFAQSYPAHGIPFPFSQPTVPYPHPHAMPSYLPTMPLPLQHGHKRHFDDDRSVDRKRRYDQDEPSSDEPEPGLYPLLSDWLTRITTDPVRGHDGINYTQFLEPLASNGLVRLDDMIRLTPTELCSKIEALNIGTSARLVDWAKRDKDKLDKAARKPPVKHYGF